MPPFACSSTHHVNSLIALQAPRLYSVLGKCGYQNEGSVVQPFLFSRPVMGREETCELSE